MSEAVDRQTLFAGTRNVGTALSFDPSKLESYLARHLEGFRGPVYIEQFKGGQSNPTYLLNCRSGRYVLRRKPPGKLLPSAHAVEREYRVTEVLHRAGFPTPRPLLLCAEADVIGTAFYLMEHVEGRIFWEPHAPGLSRGGKARIVRFAESDHSQTAHAGFHGAGAWRLR